MLKFEHIRPGSKVKAYDFEPLEGRPECAVEGFVIGHDKTTMEHFLTLACTRDLLAEAEGSQHSRVGHLIFVPMEASMDYDERVVVLEEPVTRLECLQRDNGPGF